MPARLLDGRLVARLYFGRSSRAARPGGPQAAALLAEAGSPDRRFDAIVVGEYEQAFHGDQFSEIVARLSRA